MVGDAARKNKRNKIILPWDVQSYYSEQVPEREDEEDDDEEEMNYATLQRLKTADERTRNMTRDEYVHWSDCRQASFTFRKGKRFREWAGFGVITESKPNDDIIDILGFLTFEMVQTLTEEALKVKAEEDVHKTKSGSEDAQSKKRKRETGLFDPPEEGNTPVGPTHVREAYRRLQRRANGGKAKVNLGGPRALQRTKLQLVSPAHHILHLKTCIANISKDLRFSVYDTHDGPRKDDTQAFSATDLCFSYRIHGSQETVLRDEFTFMSEERLLSIVD